ncbi:MAG: glycosyltransferase family 2 protein [Planctomycetes bacterium]|nr:glycosyltransferase family 2 protein [Planctomycetota bacterium]
MKLSIIIVSWNVKDDLLACLASLRENPLSQPFELIVIDNDSPDETVELVKQNYPEVNLIENPNNRGFAKANNQGIELATGQYVLLLNPDTIVHPDSLDILVNFMDDNPDVGACGPKLLNEDGSAQASVRRFPTFRSVLYSHTVCRLLGLFRTQYRKWMMKDFKYDRQTDVDQIMGAAMMCRHSIIDQAGGMDENFFMYFEEIDLCYKIKQAGWRIVFYPEAVISHLGGQSSKQVPLKRIMLFKSMIAYFRIHRGKLAVELFVVVFKFALILRNICHLVIGLFTFVTAFVMSNKKRQKKAKEHICLHALLLTKYLWLVITM